MFCPPYTKRQLLEDFSLRDLYVMARQAEWVNDEAERRQREAERRM